MIKTTCISTTADILKEGGIGILPFDTIWGLSGIVDPVVISKIQTLKNRPEGMPFILIVADIEAVLGYLNPLSEDVRRYMDQVWPGPTTLLLQKSKNCPDSITQGKPTVAIRIPNDPIIREIVRYIGQPIVSTSVNRSGEPPALKKESLNKEIVDRCDVLLDLDDPISGAPSTIIDCTQTPFRKCR